MSFVKKEQYYRVDVKLKDNLARKEANKTLRKVFHDLPDQIAWTERGRAFKKMGIFGKKLKGKEDKQVKGKHKDKK